jgi:hypothetical protein
LRDECARVGEELRGTFNSGDPVGVHRRVETWSAKNADGNSRDTFLDSVQPIARIIR